MSKRPLLPDGASCAWKRPRMECGQVQVGGEAREKSSVFDMSLMLYVNGYYLQGILSRFAQTRFADPRSSKPSPDQMPVVISSFIKSEWQMGKVPLLKRGPPRPPVRFVVPVSADERGDPPDVDQKPPKDYPHSHSSSAGKYGFHDARYSQKHPSDGSQRSSVEKRSFQDGERLHQQPQGHFKPSSESRNEKYGFQGTNRTVSANSHPFHSSNDSANTDSSGGAAAAVRNKVPLLPTPVQSDANEKAGSQSLVSTTQSARATAPIASTKTPEPSPQGFKQTSMTSEAIATALTSSGTPSSRTSATDQVHCSPTDAHAGINSATSSAPGQDGEHRLEDAVPGEPTHSTQTGDVQAARTALNCPPATGSEDENARGSLFDVKKKLDILSASALLAVTYSQTGYQLCPEISTQVSTQRFPETSSQNNSQQLANSNYQNGALQPSSHHLQQFAEHTEKPGGRGRDQNLSAECPSLQETGSENVPFTSDARTAGVSTRPSLSSSGLDSSLATGGQQQNFRGWYQAIIPVRARTNQDSNNGANLGLNANAHLNTNSAVGGPSSEQGPMKMSGHSRSDSQFQSTSDQSSQAPFRDQFEATFGQSQMTSTQVTFWQATSESAQEISGKLQQTTCGRSRSKSNQSASTRKLRSADDIQATPDTSQSYQWQPQRNCEQSQVTSEQLQMTSKTRQSQATSGESSMTCDRSQPNSDPSPSLSTKSSSAQPSSAQVTFEQWQETVRRIQESVQKLHQMQAQYQGKEDASSTAPSHHRSSSSSSSSSVTSALDPPKKPSRDPRKKPKGLVRPVVQQQQQQEDTEHAIVGTDPRHCVKESVARRPADLPVPAFTSTAKNTHPSGSELSRRAGRSSMSEFLEAHSGNESSSPRTTPGTDCVKNLAPRNLWKDHLVDMSEVSTQSELPEVMQSVFTAGRPASVNWGTVNGPRERDAWTFHSNFRSCKVTSTQTPALEMVQVGTMTSHASIRRYDHTTMTEWAAASDKQTMTTEFTRDVGTVVETPFTLETYTMTEPQHDAMTMTSPRTDQRGQQTSRPPVSPDVMKTCKLVTPALTQAASVKAVPPVCELPGWHGVDGRQDSNCVPLGIEISQNPGAQCVKAQTLSIPAADEGGRTVRIILRVKTRSKCVTANN